MDGESRSGTVGDSIQARWRHTVEEDPGAHAIGFYSRRDEFEWLSRAELQARASAYGRLLEESGLRSGEVCLIVLPSGERAGLVLLGALLLGAVPLLVAPPALQGSNGHLAETIERTARRTRASLAVFASGYSPGPPEANAIGSTRVLRLDGDEPPTVSEDLPAVLPGEGDIAAMQLTSGTTGFPRICAWQQRGVLAALDGMGAAMGLGDDDICFNWTPLYHDMGLVNNLLLSLTRGLPLAMLDPHDFVRDPGLWLRGLSRTGATVTWSPNFGFAVATERVADRDMEGVRLDGVRAFWNAAERIHLSTMLSFHDRFADLGVTLDALKTNFGCAENVGGATFSDPRGVFVHEWVDRRSLYEQRVATPLPQGSDHPEATPVVGVGRPYPGMEVEILSTHGEALPDGTVGEIALRTPSRMVGYVQDAVSTRHTLRGDLLRTGDLGYKRGAELFWVGRVKERITVRGKKFDPSDLEPLLFRIEGLRPGCFVAFGVDDPELGTQRAVVVSEVREPLSRDRREIVGEVRRTALDSLGISLDDVLLVPPGTLTKTSSGKRRHRHFRTLYLEGELAVLAGPDPFRSAQ